jgi:hypothetical protein
MPEEERLVNDIRRSALSIESDRLIHVTSRGGPITGLLLGSFGAFLTRNSGNTTIMWVIYDAIQVLTDNQCSRAFSTKAQPSHYRQCRDTPERTIVPYSRCARQCRRPLCICVDGTSGNSAAPAGFNTLMIPCRQQAKICEIIHQGLHRSVLDSARTHSTSGELISTEYQFFTYLKNEGFQPTLAKNGSESLLTSIMDDPDFWSHELVRRATSRMVYPGKTGR